MEQTQTESYRLHQTTEYWRDGRTLGTACEGEYGKHWFGRDEEVDFESEAAAWAWIEIDPMDLPAAETFSCERDHADHQDTPVKCDDCFTRSWERVERTWGEDGPWLVVKYTDTPTYEFFSSSRVVAREIWVSKS